MRHSLLGGLVLRSGDPVGLAQEIWAQLTVYQVMRRAMTEAAETRPGTDPDRVSFTVAREAARDQIVTAEDVMNVTPADNRFTRTVLSALLPKRRARVSARRVKSIQLRYRGGTPDERPLTSKNITHLKIAIHAQTADAPQPKPAAGTTSAAGGKRNLTLQLLRTDPYRIWSVAEIAEGLTVDHYRSLCAQLGLWAKEGLLDKTGRGHYRLNSRWIEEESYPPAQMPDSTYTLTA
ncbi:hypothetical protein [Streptomyces aureus]|uniref:Uncharacterized protein n=1 Tax=Streptomyces aureus TaxID=193461 RepID=A0ABV4T1S8_9ACTN